MPGREKIGDAYVRIHADGGNLNKDFEKSLRPLDKVMRDKGEEGSEHFSEGFRDGLKENRRVIAADLGDAVEYGFGLLDSRMSRVSKRFVTTLRGGLWEHAGEEIGERMFEGLEEALVSGTKNVEDVMGIMFDTDALANLRAKATKEIQAEEEKAEKQHQKRLEQIAKASADAAEQRAKDELAQEKELLRRKEQIAKIANQNAREAAEEQLKRDGEIMRRRGQIAKMEADNREKEARETARLEKQAADDRLRLLRQEEELENRVGRQQAQRLREMEASLGSLHTTLGRVTVGNKEYGDSVDSMRTSLRRFQKDLDEFQLTGAEGELDRLAVLRSNVSTLRKELDRATPGITRFSKGWSKLADTLGGASGRGSRNDFINFIGSAVRGLTNLVGLPIKVAGEFKSLINTFKGADSVMGGLSGVLGQLTQVSIPGLIGLAAAFTVGIQFAGLFASALSGLAGIITALAASISIALVGGIAVLGGALFSLAGIAGIAAAAFLSLDDAGKKALKESLQPLTDVFKDLADVAGEELFKDVTDQVAALVPVFEKFEPVVRKTARAMRGVFDDFAAAAGAQVDDPNSPLNRFITALEFTLPQAARRLGKSTGFALGGLAGIFTVMAEPDGILDSFYGWLKKITKEFSLWSNSDDGREQLRAFFEDAEESLSVIGDVLGGVVEMFGRLFDAGQDSGNDILQGLADALSDLNEWLSSETGQQAMDSWFDFAEDLAEKLGEVVQSAIDLWDELDNPETRALVLAFFDAVKFTLDGITGTVRVFNDVLGWVLEKAVEIKDALAGIPGLPDLVKDALPNMEQLKKAVEWLIANNPLVKSIKNIADVALPSAQQLRKAVEWLIANIPSVPNIKSIATNALPSTQQLKAAVEWLIKNIPSVPSIKNIASAALPSTEQLEAAVKWLINNVDDVPMMDNFLSAVSSAASTLVSNVQWLIDNVSRIKLPSVGGALGRLLPGDAAGAIVEGARGLGTLRRVGEAGPEAIVPLNRPLSQVDPSVRALSALAQGKGLNMASGGTVGVGRQIVIPEINVYSTATDPRAIAAEVNNIVVGAGY